MVGCAEREGRGNRGAWAAPAGVLGGRPLCGPPSLPPVLRGPIYSGGWASRPWKEEQLEMALGRKGGEGAHLWGERGLARGRRDRPEPGGARGWRSKGSRPLPQGSRPRKRGAGACRRRQAAGLAGHQDPLFSCSPEEQRPPGRLVCGRGEFPGPRSGRPASVYRPARLQAGVRWESQVGSRSCSPGPRLRIPGSRALSSPPPPHPILFPEPRPSVFLRASRSPTPQSQRRRAPLRLSVALPPR